MKKFIIDSITLEYKEDSIDNFNINSIPKNYDLLWHDDENVMELVNKYLNTGNNNILCIDKKLFEIHKSKINYNLEKIFLITATEENKTLNEVTRLYDLFLQHNITKTDKIIVVGGGIVQDIVAFTCITYKRGIPWVHFPSTLLAMSDSCIGGKCGLNYAGAKNQLALFSSPTKVIINPNFIKTLEPYDVLSGIGEIFKLFLIGGIDNFVSPDISQILLKPQIIKDMVLTALNIKKAVIEADEFESNLRKALNYGHTFGHAIESISNYKIPHGIAVVIGMLIVNELSMPKEMCDKINSIGYKLLNQDILAIGKTLSFAKILDYVKQDKKFAHGKVNLALLKKPGVIEFSPRVLDETLQKIIEKTLNNIFYGEKQYEHA